MVMIWRTKNISVGSRQYSNSSNKTAGATAGIKQKYQQQ
jgi:hypothetical protein